MKFQDSSFNGLKVTVGTKSVTHPRTHPRTHARSKSNMPHQLFQSWGHNKTHQKRDKVRAILFKINLEKPSFFFAGSTAPLAVIGSYYKLFDIYAYTEKLIAISFLCCDSRFGEINDHS